MKPKTLCCMVDCSRNAVMTVASLKRFMQMLKAMGYNAVMLYTEDTYEIPEYPFFGYMRGRYTIEEMKEIDSYGRELGIEVIPYIQVLGHLEMALKWDFLPKESKDIILPDDERTYEFIDRAFATLTSCFSTRRIHIGMDEAFGLGTGELRRINGYEPSVYIIKRHLSRIKEIGDRYGLTLLTWSDMFFYDWNGGKYWIEKKEIPKEVVDSLPRGVVPVYWDYYSLDYERYDAMLSNHKQLSPDTWFAGGVWGWRGMIPYNRFTINTMTKALDACHDRGCENIIFCMWGDDGNECSRYSHLPSLYYLAKYAHGVRDTEEIKAGFEDLFGVPFDEYLLIDEPNRPGNGKFGYTDLNPSRYMLYSDCFLGFKDCFAEESDEGEFAAIADKLHTVAERYPDYALCFESASRLCRVLSVKYALGIKTRRAYRENNLSELARLSREEYTALLTLIPGYIDAFRAQWDGENKPHGFDLQDLRLGGLLQRIASCKRRIEDYVAGRVESIPELCDEVLPRDDIFKGKWRSGAYLFTPNVFEGI